MTNTLGGGGDFTHFMDHLGPALKSWVDDMEQNKFDLGSEEQVDGLKKNVNGWTSQVDLKKVEGDRDVLLTELVKRKLDQTENQ